MSAVFKNVSTDRSNTASVFGEVGVQDIPTAPVTPRQSTGGRSLWRAQPVSSTSLGFEAHIETEFGGEGKFSLCSSSRR